MPPARDRLRSALEEPWFHSIDFGDGLVSRGRFPSGRPQNYTLYGVLGLLERLDVTDRECLDIGTMDGIVAFTLKLKNAKRVIATDVFPRKTFRLGRNYLGLDIEYRHPVRIDDLRRVIGGQMLDLIVCAGILYHVFEPLTALVICREQLKENGLFILETQYLHSETEPVVSFSPSDTKRGNRHANTFFRPSYRALMGMMEVAGFHVITTVAVNGRITVLAKAVKPSRMNGSTEVIRKIHESYMGYDHYNERINYQALEDCRLASSIACNGNYRKDYYLFSSSFSTNNPLQPRWNPDGREKARAWWNDLSFKTRTCIARRKLLPDFDEAPA